MGQLSFDQPKIPHARLDFVVGMLDTWFAIDAGRKTKKRDRNELHDLAEVMLLNYGMYVEREKEAQ